MQKILVIDDDRDTCLMLNRFLTRQGFEVFEAYNGKKALDMLESVSPDLVMTDFRLGDMDGSEVVTKIKERYYHIPVLVITAYSDIKTAVEIMKMGAYDYITKPLFPDEIVVTIRKALESAANEKAAPVTSQEPASANGTVTRRRAASSSMDSPDYLFGSSQAMKEIYRQIELVAPTDYSVIIHGESGSGKEGLALEIHKRSRRKDKPFIPIDCGALSKDLAMSELFGHEKGSFTGAVGQKIGSFENANGGTIFLDEIANLSYEIQVGLLRVIQERKVRRVGGLQDIPLDVRIIVASNERLWDATRKGKFREDLFHRFNEFSIDIPPLRERSQDIMLYADHFLNVTTQQLGKQIKGFDKEVEEAFRNYVWYGNLRELRNVIKRAALLTDGDYIEARSLPFEIINFRKLQFEKPAAETSGVTTPGALKADPSPTSLKSASRDAEYEMILQALKKANYNKSKAAKLLDIDRKTLYNKMQQYQEFNNE
ncbi:MAG TPA: sigma-54 dependent transcriptional regulator [Chitinophagaceae bacterium]